MSRYTSDIIYSFEFIVIIFFLVLLAIIEIYQGGYITASLPEQILVMYGYSIAFEAAGFFLPYYILIYHFNLIEFKDRGV